MLASFDTPSFAQPSSAGALPDTIEARLAVARRNMIEQQIRPWDVLEPGVLALLDRLPRHHFVPAADAALAYVDTTLPLPMGQEMLAPKLEARVLQELDIEPMDKVFLVGAGSGYLAALIGLRAYSVTAIEIEPSLVVLAQDNIQRAGLSNVVVLEGDGLADDPRWHEREFDVIVLAGSVRAIPQNLLGRLKPDGRLLAFVGEAPVQTAQMVEHRGASTVTVGLFETHVAALRGQAPRKGFEF